MCPLCQAKTEDFCETSPGRRYFACPVCDLISLDPALHLAPTDEKSRYLEHNNSDTPEYRAFLRRLWNPLRTKLKPRSRGLDFGSGPGPVLTRILVEEGFQATSYDPFFDPNASALEQRYDFIACSETAEHFFSPRIEFDRFRRLLSPGGWLGIQTQILDDRAAFKDWYYHRDPTHVVFYSADTMRWIAKFYGYCLEMASTNVALFQFRD